jgi:hypothetical protein
MVKPMNLIIRFAAIVLLSIVLYGCPPPVKKIHIDYNQRASRLHAIGVLDPELTYYELSFGGMQEKHDEWSLEANQNVVAAITAALSSRGYAVKTIAREGALKPTLEEIAGLYDIITWSYRNHVLMAQPANVFPHKAASLDYSVGPIDEILDANHVDALILVDGGGAGNSAFVRGRTVILVALIDRTGALLWYEPFIREAGAFTSTDIRNPEAVRSMIETIFETMPTVQK